MMRHKSLPSLSLLLPSSTLAQDVKDSWKCKLRRSRDGIQRAQQMLVKENRGAKGTPDSRPGEEVTYIGQEERRTWTTSKQQRVSQNILQCFTYSRASKVIHGIQIRKRVQGSTTTVVGAAKEVTGSAPRDLKLAPVIVRRT